MSNRQHRDDRADRDELRDRLDAVERALTDGDGGLDDLQTAADAAGTIEDVRDRVAEIEDRITELDAATQALRGYVGNVRSVNRDVERRADAALAKVESLEAELEGARDADGDAVAADSQPLGAPDDANSTDAVEGGATARGRSAGTGQAAPCRCAHCGAPREDAGDERSRASESSERRERGGGGEPTAGERPAADGGHDEWARETARARGESDGSDGLLSGLRDAL